MRTVLPLLLALPLFTGCTSLETFEARVAEIKQEITEAEAQRNAGDITEAEFQAKLDAAKDELNDLPSAAWGAVLSEREDLKARGKSFLLSLTQLLLLVGLGGGGGAVGVVGAQRIRRKA